MAPRTEPTRVDELADELTATLEGHVAQGDPLGLAWAVGVGGEYLTGALGHLDASRTRPVGTDTIFRISSMTKPVVSAGAMVLVDEGALRLDDPIEEFLPELTDRRVLLRPDGPIRETAPARRPITLEDVLTFRLGLGMDFTTGPTPMDEALAASQVAPGPPAPLTVPAPDEWLRRLSDLPLQYQPGERWLYHFGAQLLGVLITRAAGMPLEEWLRRRVFEPLGMTDTGFWVRPGDQSRFGACFGGTDPETGTPDVYDPADGQWSSPPAFPGGGDGLVSTVEDYRRFAAMLQGNGRLSDVRVLSEESVRAMTTNQLTDDQVRASSPAPDGSTGWGLGVGVALAQGNPDVVGSYGWDGGLGSSWRNDTARDLVGVLLTNQMWTSPAGAPVSHAFWDVLARRVPLN